MCAWGGGFYKHRALRQCWCQVANFRTRSMKYKPKFIPDASVWVTAYRAFSALVFPSLF